MAIQSKQQQAIRPQLAAAALMGCLGAAFAPSEGFACVGTDLQDLGAAVKFGLGVFGCCCVRYIS